MSLATDDHLRALFRKNCKCSTIDFSRADHEHSIDCNTGVLELVQTALFAVDDDEAQGARFMCAQMSCNDEQEVRP